MLSITLLALLPLLITAQSTSTASSTPCLSPGESYNIALRWLQIFQTNENGTGTGSAIIDSTLAPNLTVSLLFHICRCLLPKTHTNPRQYYDEGASFGNATPVYDSSAAVYSSVSGSGYSGALVTNVTYSIVEQFASCDTSVVRWQSDSLSANATGV